jgi:signal peptidase
MVWHYTKRALFGVIALAFIAAAAGALYVIRVRSGRILSVQSGSMVPTFHKGDLVETIPVPEFGLRPGDIITFVSPKDAKVTLTHRIVQTPSVTNGYKFVTKGDANMGADSPIDPTLVVGRVEHHIPKLGYLADFVRTPAGLLIIIYVPALLIVGEEIRRLSKYYKSREPWREVHYAGHEHFAARHLHEAHHLQGTGKPKVAPTAGLILLLGGIIILSGHSFAALSSQATLAGNTIRTISKTPENPPPVTPPPTTDKIAYPVIEFLKFTCSNTNTADLNKRPSITIYNPSSTDIDISGWYLQGSNGRIATLPAGTTIASHTNYYVDGAAYPNGVAYPVGLKYAGDYTALYNATGTEIDGLSWGSDTSRLSPSLPVEKADYRYKRTAPVNTDAGTANEWQVLNGGGCAPADQPGGSGGTTPGSTSPDVTFTPEQQLSPLPT